MMYQKYQNTIVKAENKKKNRTGTHSAVVNIVHRIGHYNLFVKFECYNR